MPSFEEIQKARILNSFNTDEGLSELTKAEILDIEKGGKRAMIGEKRTFAGREYIKTASGWKFHGKGTGSKAQEHVAGALEHHVGEKSVVGFGDFKTKRENMPKDFSEVKTYPMAMTWLQNKYGEHFKGSQLTESELTRFQKIKQEDKATSADRVVSNEKESEEKSQIKIGDIIKLTEPVLASLSDLRNKPLKVVSINEVNLASGSYNELLVEDSNGKSREIREDMVEKQEQQHPNSTKSKNATDHFVEQDGKHYIDTLDPDTGEKKFKPGDKVHYIDDDGKKHKGTLSDREHPDGDMFEVDREGDEKGKTEFDKLQQSYNEKVNSLNLLKNDGWKGSFSTNSTTKSYGEEKFVKEMIVRVEMTLKTKDTYFSVDCGYAKSPEFGEEADNYYSKLTSLKEKKFTTAREAAKAADKFADDWNKEE